MVGDSVSRNFEEKLAEIVNLERILKKEPLCRHTTFQIGGAADYFLEAESQKEAVQVRKLCAAEGMDCFLIGNGSNLLVSDQGYRGLVLRLSAKAEAHFWEEGGMLYARAGAGESLMSFAKSAANMGAAGFEFACGIPGSIGGAICMNAGAYGGEIKDCLKRVLTLDPDGAMLWKDAADLKLAYRDSIFKDGGEYVLEAEFAFCKGDAKEALEKIANLMRLRKEKQPLEYPSAGSTFKRPEGHFAGKLIMEAGLAGFRVGGAQVSQKHCGFLINAGGASAADMMCLIRQVQDRVEEKFGIFLEPEVKFLGDFGKNEKGEFR